MFLVNATAHTWGESYLQRELQSSAVCHSSLAGSRDDFTVPVAHRSSPCSFTSQPDDMMSCSFPAPIDQQSVLSEHVSSSDESDEEMTSEITSVYRSSAEFVKVMLGGQFYP